MDIKEKQARWALEKPLFEVEFIHSHLLPFFHFNENTGDYEIKTESVNNTDEEDRKVAYESLNTGWAMWLRAKRTAKTQVPKGFVLVPKKTNDDITYGILDKVFSCSFCHDSPESWGRSYEKIIESVSGSIIEAQEQSHA